MQRRYCGFSDPPLNHEGIRQSQRLAVKLRDTRIDNVYSSDLIRACETAKIVFPHISIEKTADLREMNFGLFEGLTYEQNLQRYPKLYGGWLDDPEKTRIPNGEGLTDLSSRIRRRLSLILSGNRDKTAAVVTHGGPIRIVLCKALKLDLKKFWNIEQGLGALNIIDYSEIAHAVVVKMNDIAHLHVQEESAL